MKRRSRAGSVKSRRRKPAAPKRTSGAEAARPRGSTLASQESEAARLASELSAMSEILRLISNSPSNVTAVLQSVAEQAAHICQAQYVAILVVENDELHDAAWFGELTRTPAIPLDRSSVAGRSVCDMRPVNVDDVQNAGDEFPRGREIGRTHGVRSIIAVPLIRENRALGTIVVRRTEVRPFERKHLDLLTNFAAQAVIAIENARLLSDLRESLQRQTATADVLRIINSSAGKLEPVFQAILGNAVHICEAMLGFMVSYDGATFQPIANVGGESAFLEFVTRRPFQPSPETVLGRVKNGMQTVQVEDLAASRGYAERDPIAVAAVELARVRTFLGVPMIRNDKLLGIILLYRQEVGLFTEKQVELVENFAAQAAIAIENARLLNELRQRTADLSESLEQQTATSQVLSVISSSPGELEPVFNAMLESATRICEARFGNLFLYADNAFQAVAIHNAPPVYAEIRKRGPIRPSPGSGLGRLAETRQVVHITDMKAEPTYAARDPFVTTGVDMAGIRTLLAVPMLREGQLVGAFSIFRQEVRPFSEKQIALIQNFAAQAVIAIENARLLSELRQRTDEVVKLNQQLEQRVADQVGEIERMGRLRRFLPPQVADLIVASGSEKQLESHRREITALFCDLRGFTGFSESSDPEDVMALLAEYHAAIGEIIIKYSGTLERYAGDGVMVIFNDPVPVENPALQAVLMALDMRTAIERLMEKWRLIGHDIGFGIGIAHGFATLGTIGFEGRRDYAAIGTVSNVASRLCDEAKPGQILISPRVLLAVDKAVTVESVGEFALKGIRRPMAGYNVLGAIASKNLN
jgi:GAF domain-containing protein